MDNSIKRLYELLYSPIVTPYTLLANAKLQNYAYVNYYKGKKGLIAEMKCRMEDKQDVIFFYHFDADDMLSQIYSFDETSQETSLIFDRNREIDAVKAKYLVDKQTEVAM